MDEQENNDHAPIKSSIAQDVIRKYHKTPMTFYRIKDQYVDIVTNPNFLDSLLVIAALLDLAPHSLFTRLW